MGAEGSKQSLVIMTNGDVYYVERSAAKKLIEIFQDLRDSPEIYLVTDQKTRAIIAIKTAHISSIVNKEADHAQ